MKKFLFIIFVLFTLNLIGCSSTKYTISFNSNGGSTVDSITQDYNTTVTKPSDPTMVGYTFGGWYSDEALSTAYTITTMPSEDITLYAKWNINQYTISFDVDGGSTVDSIIQDYHTTVTQPSDPINDEYTFGGWYSDEALSTAYTFTTMPAGNITLYAKWESKYEFLLLENGEEYGVKIKDSIKYHFQNLTIVSEYNNKPVTTILDEGFKNCINLKSIIIPDSITSIGASAFNNCISLTSITIPEGVTSIEPKAFAGCTSLTSITISESVTSIGDYAFYGCTSLTSITIPNAVTSIGESSFYGCTSFTNVTIPEGVTSIGSCSFENCTFLTSITLPKSVTIIGNFAFFKCSSLTSITIPKSVTSMGYYVFAECDSLTIYCEASSILSGWGDSWNSNRPVVWGYVSG